MIRLFLYPLEISSQPEYMLQYNNQASLPPTINQAAKIVLQYLYFHNHFSTGGQEGELSVR